MSRSKLWLLLLCLCATPAFAQSVTHQQVIAGHSYKAAAGGPSTPILDAAVDWFDLRDKSGQFVLGEVAADTVFLGDTLAVSASDPTHGADGISGDGVDDFLRLGNWTLPSVGDFTWVVRARYDGGATVSSNDAIMGFRTSTLNNLLKLEYNADAIRATPQPDGSSGKDTYAIADDGAFANIVLRRSGDDYTMWVDGVLRTTRTNAGAWTQTPDAVYALAMWYEASVGTYKEYDVGQATIALLAHYATALSDADIANLNTEINDYVAP